MTYQDRQRVAKCGCHYDIVTGSITHYCEDLENCEFEEERIKIVKAIKAMPGMGHILGINVSRIIL